MQAAHIRITVAALALSAAGFIGIVQDESFTAEAVLPTQGDRPTIGLGSTRWEDGRPVELGQSITPARALVVASAHITREEASFRRSLPGVLMYQGEYDLYMNFVYQFGTGAWWGSSMRRELLGGNYSGACKALLAWRKQGGRDCSLPDNWGPKGCKGVWTRQLARQRMCMKLQP